MAAAGVLFCASPVAAAVVPAPAWAPIAVSGPTNLPPVQSEVQRVGVDAEGGTFVLSFNSQTTTSMPFDATAAEVQARLNALSSIAPGSVTVSGGPGNRNGDHPYFVSFDGGALAQTDVNQIVADGSALEGGGIHNALVSTVVQGGPGKGMIVVYVQNVGGVASSGTITVEDQLPPALTIAGPVTGQGWECPSPGPTTVVCTTTQSVAPGRSVTPLTIPVRVGAATPEPETNRLIVSGGGGAAVAYGEPVTISTAAAKSGVQAFTAGFHQVDGSATAQAGSHPDLATFAVFLNTATTASGQLGPAGDAKTIAIHLPPGLLVNPTAIPGCTEGLKDDECPLETQVGIVEPIINFGAPTEVAALHSVKAPLGYPATMTFTPLTASQFKLFAGLRSDEDHGTTAELSNIVQERPIYGAFFTLWGTPADPGHDQLRCLDPQDGLGCGPSAASPTAFVTEPTACTPQAAPPPRVGLSFDTWQRAGEFERRSVALPPVSGCERLGFDAHFSFAPEAGEADSPSVFRARLTTSTEGLTDPAKLAPGTTRYVVAKLPRGVVVNPSFARGLGFCSESQIGLENELDPVSGLPLLEPMPNPIRFDRTPNRCPDAAKIGTVEVKTALLEGPLKGALYLAAQGSGNPFGSLVALYLAVEDPATGTVIKLAGEASLDQRTGQVAIALDNLPQLPFESLSLTFKGGPGALLATPTTCGLYTSEALGTPWSAPESGPPLRTEDSFAVNAGPGRSACVSTPAERPFAPGLNTGSASASAGAFTPFLAQITRPDGSQELETLELTAPPGLAATLRGVPYCPEAQIAAAEERTATAEKANPSCPEASRVGSTNTGAGSGPAPLYVPGRLYLGGPYGAAPLSLVSVTPGIAGPFDLGNLVIRSGLYVDPTTAQITARTDRLPGFLKGVALRVRDLRMNFDRPGWIRNPTSCEALRVRLTAHGDSGAVPRLSSRFQVDGCAALAFKPKLKLGLTGATGRNGYPALTATLAQSGGQANVGSASVTLPRSEFLAQEHIRAVCTRARFAAHACPAGSVYGRAEATTPLLDQPLSGPVYLRSSEHKLPDLVAALRGPDSQPIEIDLVGRVDSVSGRIRVSFAAIPDVPIGKFVLRMHGGKKGLLANSRNLCAKRSRATVRLIGQNGKRADQFPVVRSQCGKAAERPSAHHGKPHAHRELSRLLAAW